MNNCLICGRFAHFYPSKRESNSNYGWIIISWFCSKCGYCEEGT